MAPNLDDVLPQAKYFMKKSALAGAGEAAKAARHSARSRSRKAKVAGAARETFGRIRRGAD
jgi:hypothetical protein